MPTITVPATVTPAASFTIAGQGFGSRTNVRLLIGTNEVAYFTTGQAGTFSRTAKAPGVGDHPVQASSTRGCAGATLAVRNSTPPPDPEPEPPPVGRPWAAPVTTSETEVPASVTDIAALNTWIAGLADRTIVNLRTREYAGTQGLKLERRNHIVVRLSGATIHTTGPADQDNSSGLIARASNHVAFQGPGTLIGNDPGPLTSSRGEKAHALTVSGWYGGAPNTYIEISGCTASKWHGDFAYLEGENVGAHRPSQFIWIHHNKATDITRNFDSPINSTDILVEDNEWDRIGYHVHDIEPNLSVEQVRRYTVRRDKGGSYGHRQNLLGFFLRNWNPPNSSPVSDISVTHCAVTGNPAAGYGGKPLGLNTRFDSPSSNVVFEDNTTTRAVPGPVLVFANVSGLTVRRNTQPLTSGPLTSFSNCSNVVT